MTVKSLVAQLCLTLCDPMHCSPLGSSVHEILQARILGSPFSRGPSQPRDQTWVSHIAGRFFTIWITREALNDSGLFQIYPIIVPIVVVISNIVFLINSLKQPLAFSNFIFSILIIKNQSKRGHSISKKKKKKGHSHSQGFSWWLSWYRIHLRCRRPGFNP